MNNEDARNKLKSILDSLEKKDKHLCLCHLLTYYMIIDELKPEEILEILSTIRNGVLILSEFNAKIKGKPDIEQIALLVIAKEIMKNDL